MIKYISEQKLSKVHRSSFILLLLFTVYSAKIYSQEPVINSLASYYSEKDNYHHTIVAADGGKLYELYFKPNSSDGIHSTLLGCFGKINSVGAYYSSYDYYQHAIVALQNGEIKEVYFDPARGIKEARLGNFQDIKAISAYYSAEDGNQHVIVAQNDGTVAEMFFKGGQGIGIGKLYRFNEQITAVAAYPSPDGYQHVIVGTKSGNVWEVFFKPGSGDPIGAGILKNVSGNITSVAGYYAYNDKRQHVIVGTKTGEIWEIFFRPFSNENIGIGKLRTINGSEIITLSAYSGASDSYQHVIVGTADGNVREIFFIPSSGQGIGMGVLKKFDLQKPVVEDISPDIQNGVVSTGPSTSGYIIGIAGNDNLLFAASPNAGIWRSSKAQKNGTWEQLSNSPKYPFCIVADPQDPGHVLVGERNGDFNGVSENTGLWESNDAGSTWHIIYDVRNTTGCTSQAVTGIGFTGDIIFASTSCGVIKKMPNKPAELLSATKDFGVLNSLTISNSPSGSSIIWTRSKRKLFYSFDFGNHWTSKDIPNKIGDYTISVNDRNNVRGMDYSLAAYGSRALIPFNNISTSNPTTINSLLYFNADKQDSPWTIQDINIHFGNGVGLGGRYFIKAYENPTGGYVFFYCSGQEIIKGSGFNSDGTIIWNNFCQSPWPLSPGETYAYPTNNVHVDFWDLFMSTGASSNIWLAGDGGIFQQDQNSLDWRMRNSGLHTQHAHKLTLVQNNHIEHSRIAYGTADNDAWYRDVSTISQPLSNWQSLNILGDADWAAADVGNPEMILMARHPNGSATISAYNKAIPTGAKFTESGLITLIKNLDGVDPVYNGPLFFQFIQTPLQNNEFKTLDAVMLVKRPVSYVDVSNHEIPVPGILGQSSSGSGIALIRNRTFAANPDINLLYRNSYNNASQWEIVKDNLPSGTVGFWVSGNHSNQVYYLITIEGGFSTSVIKRSMYKLSGDNLQKLNIDNISEFERASYGPAFIDPFDANYLAVLTKDGVMISKDGGTVFTNDLALSNLLKGQGNFPLDKILTGANETNIVDHAGTHAFDSQALSCLTFGIDNPNEMVAAGFHTGLFYNSGNGIWIDLTLYLPKPLTPISSVAFDGEAIYVATEGRSIYRILNYQNAGAFTR